MAETQDVIGVPNDEQALAAVGGGDREIHEAEKQQYAERIQDAARANSAWRASLPFEQQLALANTPTVTFPSEDNSEDSEPATEQQNGTGSGNGAGV